MRYWTMTYRQRRLEVGRIPYRPPPEEEIRIGDDRRLWYGKQSVALPTKALPDGTTSDDPYVHLVRLLLSNRHGVTEYEKAIEVFLSKAERGAKDFNQQKQTVSQGVSKINKRLEKIGAPVRIQGSRQHRGYIFTCRD